MKKINTGIIFLICFTITMLLAWLFISFYLFAIDETKIATFNLIGVTIASTWYALGTIRDLRRL